MSELLVNYPDRAPERLPLGRLRITIGRSARNDVCVPDPFASRVHAEVRREGDGYVLQDLGSANGTYYNGSRLEQPVALTHGSRIQIGETEIVFKDRETERQLPETTIEEDSPLGRDRRGRGGRRPRRPARAHLEGRRHAPRLGDARRDAGAGGAPRLRGRARRALPHHAARGRAGRAEDTRRRDARQPPGGGRGAREPHHRR